jgi:hypothetical protein
MPSLSKASNWALKASRTGRPNSMRTSVGGTERNKAQIVARFSCRTSGRHTRRHRTELPYGSTRPGRGVMTAPKILALRSAAPVSFERMPATRWG